MNSSEQLEEIKAEMCDKYCRYPFSADDDYLNKKCTECPMNRLEINNGEQP